MACSSICRKAGYHVLTRGQWSSLGGNSCLIPGAVDVYRVVVLLCSYARSDYKRSNWQREWLSFSRSFLPFRVGALSLSLSWIKQIIIFMMISRISVYDVGKSKPKLMFSVCSSRHLKNQRQVRGAQTFSVRKCSTALLKPLSASWQIQASSLQWGNLKRPMWEAFQSHCFLQTEREDQHVCPKIYRCFEITFLLQMFNLVQASHIEPSKDLKSQNISKSHQHLGIELDKAWNYKLANYQPLISSQ